MGQPKEDLFFLTNESGASYYVNNGLVDHSTTPKPLPISPDGWQTKSIKFTRNAKYLALFRTFTTPLKVVRQGAQIIRDRLYRIGTEDKIYLVINKLDRSFGGGWIHRLFYKGELDLTQADDEETHISVNIMEGGLTKLFNANSGTVYAVDINGPLVKDDGLLLYQKALFSVVDGFEILKSIWGTNFFIPVSYIQSEGQSTGIDFSSQTITGVGGLSFTDKITDTHGIANGNPNDRSTISTTVTGVVKFMITHNDLPFGIRLRFLTSELTLVTQFAYEIVVPGPFTAGLTKEIPFSFTVPFIATTQFHLEGIFVGGVTGAIDIGIQFLPGSDFSISFTNKFKTTFTNCMRPVALAQALLDKITGGAYVFQSDYLSTYWDNLVVTSGDAVRGLPGAQIKTSFDDFFQSYNTPCNISLGIQNNVLRIEEKGFAFDNTIIADLGEVTKFGIKPAAAYQYNVVKIGYPNLDTHTYQSLNGKEEFNVTSTFTSPVTRVNKVLDLTSKYKASMYEQELARLNLEGLTTTADTNDASVFFKHIEKYPTAGVLGVPEYYNLLRPAFDSVTGLLDPASAYNLLISPKNCLLNHGNYLRSVFYWLEAGSLVFQTSDRNAALVTVKAGVTIAEGTDENIGSLDDPLFIPLSFNVDSPMPDGMIDIMNATPAGTLQFSYNGETFYMLADTVSIQPANKAVQTTTGLCSTLTDITKLIDR